MLWFIKTLNETTTNDIEFRVMAEQGTNNKDMLLDMCNCTFRVAYSNK